MHKSTNMLTMLGDNDDFIFEWYNTIKLNYNINLLKEKASW